MNKWDREVQQSLLNSEVGALSALEKQYKAALADINKKIKEFQAEIELLDSALNQAGMDEATRALLKSRQQSKIYQKQFQEAMKAQVGGILDKMQGDQYSTLESYLKGCYKDSYTGTVYSLAQQGLPVITPINQESVVRAVLLDSKVSNGLYSGLGVNVGKLKKTITQEISRGIASGLSYRDIARNIANTSGSGYSNAKRIAITEGHRIQNTAARDAAEEAQAHGADLVKQWDATLDGATRPSHRMVDGEIRETDEKFSNGLMYPGDPSGAAGEVIHCRCALLHKPRWAIDGGVVKRDNFTGETRVFDSPKDYAAFKGKYWSKENIAYMQHVTAMEKKYETKRFETLLGKMTDGEYQKLKELEKMNPLFKNPVDTSPQTSYIDSTYGATHATAVKSTLQNADGDVKAVWNKYQGRFKTANAKYTGPQANYSPATGSVTLDISKAASGSTYQTPYQVLFHEYGHMTDYLAARDAGFSNYTAFTEVFDGIDQSGKAIFTSKGAGGLLGRTAKQELKDALKNIKQAHGVTRKADAVQILIDEINKNYSLKARSDVSDMLEGAGIGVAYPLGVGHGKSYWKQRDNGKEIFAEIISAEVSNPESLKCIKQYFPETYKTFRKILEVIK